MVNKAPPPLQCVDVSFAYPNGVAATVDVNLTLHEGEIFCLLGPNGAGKTTLAKQITGFLRPDSGRVCAFGHDLSTSRRQALSMMGIIPQEVGLFRQLSAQQHLRYFSAIKGIRGKQREIAIAEAVETCRLENFLEKPSGLLSLGQRRKVLLAIALMGSPRLLVLDEPTVGLDPVSRRDLWTALKRERMRGACILLTTHYLDEAQHLSDRIGMFNDGKLIATGTLADFVKGMGKEIRVSVQDIQAVEDRADHFFETRAQAEQFVREGGFASYSVSQVSLEDIYLSYFGRNKLQ